MKDGEKLIARVPPRSLGERLDRLPLGPGTVRVVLDEVDEWLRENNAPESLRLNLITDIAADGESDPGEPKLTS